MARLPSLPRLSLPASRAFPPRSFSTLPKPLRPNARPELGYGQPLPFSHPHLLRGGELTIGIQAGEYEERRRRLMDGLEEGSVVVVAGGRIKFMSANIL